MIYSNIILPSKPKNSLKVLERYEKFLQVSFSVKKNSLPAPPSGREDATS